MTELRKIGRSLKGDPVSSLAATTGIEGFKVRTEILRSDIEENMGLADERIFSILSNQQENGSWGDTIAETAGNVNLLLDYGCPPDHVGINAAKDWLLTRQIIGGKYYEGLFMENGYELLPRRLKREERIRLNQETDLLNEKYAEFNPWGACGAHTMAPTSSALEVFFRTGEDVSSNDRLALAVDIVIALGNKDGYGICEGNIVINGMRRKRKVKHEYRSWTKKDNRLFRRACEENPGIPICAHHFLRATSYSRELLHSAMVTEAVKSWKKHQLENGNFETEYHLYDFYFAVDTLRLFRELPEAAEMFGKTIPAILRRQRKDGLWRKKGDWVTPTFSVVYALHQFGYL